MNHNINIVNLCRFSRAVCLWKTVKHFAHLQTWTRRHIHPLSNLILHNHTWIYEIFYHVGWESCGWIGGVWQWAGEACTSRGGESSRSRVRAEGWARGRPRQVFIPRGSQSRGPVSRTRIKSQRARGLVEVTLRIGHWWARYRSPIPKRKEKTHRAAGNKSQNSKQSTQ